MVVAQKLKEAEITEQDSLLLSIIISSDEGASIDFGFQDSSPQKIMATRASNLDDLPDFIIQKVLTHLPIRDAARTSTLSKKWRNHWRNIPALVFDGSFFRAVCVAVETERDREEIYALLALSQVLLFHRGSIHKFSLTFPLESCSQIDNVMLFLCDKDVHEFSFDLEMENHTMPSYLFAYQQLRHLFLGNCDFKDPHLFRGFPHLISLIFYRVDFDSIECNTFISNCPLLERLDISTCKNILSLEIGAPMLKSLIIRGSVGSLLFNNTPLPLLSSVRIQCFMEFGNAGEGLATNVIRFFECLPVVEYLCIEELNFMPEEKLPTSPRLPITISHLKVLEVVGDLYGESDLSLLLALIISSPNLQKLKLVGESPRPAQEADPLNLLECEDLSDVTFQKLQHLEMSKQCEDLSDAINNAADDISYSSYSSVSSSPFQSYRKTCISFSFSSPDDAPVQFGDE